MVKKLKLALILLLGLTKAFSQDSNELNRFSHGEYKSFREYMQRNVYFPPEAFNRTGVLLAGFVLSPKGEIVNVFTLNSLASAIDNQILDLIETTSGFWKAKQIQEQSNKNSIILIPIVFCLKNTEWFVNDQNIKLRLEDKIEFTVMAGQEQMSASGYTKTEKLVKSIDELILKGKFEKANEVVSELLRRDPLNTDYYSKLIEIEIKLGNIDKACKKLQFVKAYLIQQPKEFEIDCN